MQAEVGDRVVVRSRRVGVPGRVGEVVAVRGEAGRPPYVVRWDDGREALFFPGPDATVETRRRAR